MNLLLSQAFPLTTAYLSFIRWSTRIMSLGWNCHSWQNSETLGSVSMVT